MTQACEICLAPYLSEWGVVDFVVYSGTLSAKLVVDVCVNFTLWRSYVWEYTRSHELTALLIVYLGYRWLRCQFCQAVEQYSAVENTRASAEVCHVSASAPQVVSQSLWIILFLAFVLYAVLSQCFMFVSDRSGVKPR